MEDGHYLDCRKVGTIWKTEQTVQELLVPTATAEQNHTPSYSACNPLTNSNCNIRSIQACLESKILCVEQRFRLLKGVERT